MKRATLFLSLLGAGLLLGACAYRPWAGDLKPLEEARQSTGMAVEDDGTVIFTKGRLDIRLRPMSDEEMNRQFSTSSDKGARSTNPYTFGNSTSYITGNTPKRFTVFRLNVKNYEYPKVRLAGEVVLESANGRKYYALSLQQLEVYYRIYATGFRGNEYREFNDRKTLLQRTMFPKADDIFSGQEQEGYVLFEPLADDVKNVTVTIEGVVIRFDYRGEPAESIAASYRFARDLGRVHPDKTDPNGWRVEVTDKI
jgi:hypothetical protein